MNNLFPVFLKLEELHTLVVGGGIIGMEKLSAILTNSPKATVTLVAPEIRNEIRELAAEHANLHLMDKFFDESDLNGMDLVVAATSIKEVNAHVKECAKKRKVLANIADTPHLCDFYLGSIVQKGDLKIAISTNGKSPTLAKRLREMFAEIIPEGTQKLLENLKEVRDALKGDFEYKVKRLNEITTVVKQNKEVD
ncbi:MAG TPA: siroheme synthase [Cytophagales bacterium]|nr:siroheme synthase [Cytophagales bacterium]